MRQRENSKTKAQYIALARVSSRAQEMEGTSLEVQEQALRAYAADQGAEIIRLWKITETASKAERRIAFKEMVAYAIANADKLKGLLVYKIDRAARNMADYGRLLELEVGHGIPLIAGQPANPEYPCRSHGSKRHGDDGDVLR